MENTSGDWSFCKSVSSRNDCQRRIQLSASEEVLVMLQQVGDSFIHLQYMQLVLNRTKKVLKVQVFLAVQKVVDMVRKSILAKRQQCSQSCCTASIVSHQVIVEVRERAKVSKAKEGNIFSGRESCCTGRIAFAALAVLQPLSVCLSRGRKATQKCVK